MNTTDEIMKLANTLAGKYRYYRPGDDAVLCARTALRTAVNELVEQAAWAHHQPALLTEADAAADLAGVARPGAEAVPMFWVRIRSDGMYEGPIHNAQIEQVRKESGGWTPLYTTPQASQPLTDEQIEQCIKQAHSTVQGRNLEHAFARAIEAAHGIGAAQKGKP